MWLGMEPEEERRRRGEERMEEVDDMWGCMSVNREGGS
jgi:hypothetical protein